MSSIGTGYDLSAAQFSPDGRVFQIEYANKAVENSGTAVAIRGKDGVVFAVEKLVTSKLHERSVNQRISTIDRHVGVAITGLFSDARTVIEETRQEASKYRSHYCQPIPLKVLVDRMSSYMHVCTLYSGIRPFGCSLIFGSYSSSTGPQLFMTDPSGVSWGYKACAVGKAKQAAKTELEKLKMSDMTLAELVKEATRIIYAVHDEVKDKDFELELSWVGEATEGLHQLVPEDVKASAVDYAKDSLKESDSEEELEQEEAT
ncbi:Proteasome subunit alpha type-3 [Geodia barretti]|uniref:Proteasome subunit alpha type-3 n=1 Tax=Geodia barretti TaxID=519541 RepID=A0AA35RKG0_GEOBA|nr:Proteasome subunit alpha type-3 [Geodia barretti]